ncbi:MAG: EamA family transporter [Chloroflexota bacterium]
MEGAGVRAIRFPPHLYFLVSAIFHYLGPAFAVLLFAHVSVLGVAWLRIASAAVVFAVWRRPWRTFVRLPAGQKRLLLAFGSVLGAMNVCFYLAISMLPLGTVGAIEFVGPIVLAAIGIHTRRNIAAVILAAVGGWLLTQVQFGGQPLGLVFAFGNCGLFVLYVILGHRIAQNTETSSIDRLGAAMLIALVVVSPVGFIEATPAFMQPDLLLAGIGVGICSSVIPYVLDQFAMSRLPRATFALLLSLLPAFATMIGVLVLSQVPTPTELAGIGMIVGAVAVHQERH